MLQIEQVLENFYKSTRKYANQKFNYVKIQQNHWARKNLYE